MPWLKRSQNYQYSPSVGKVKRNGFQTAFVPIILPRSTPCQIQGSQKYTGEFKGDLRNGKGFQEVRNEGGNGSTIKVRYEGDWVKGREHGYGIMWVNCGCGKGWKRAYSGQWRFGKPVGHGIKSFEEDENAFYRGQFSQGLRHGMGVMIYPDGTMYAGHWKNDQKDGVGRLVSRNGNFYEGEFKEGRKSGRGRYYFKERGHVMDGVWLDNVCVVSYLEDDGEVERMEDTMEDSEASFPPIGLNDPKKVFEKSAKAALAQVNGFSKGSKS